MGKITEWVILESDFGTGGKWLFLDMPLTYPINIKCKARNIGGVNGGWNGVEYFNLTWTSASDVKIKDIQTIGKIELFDNGNGTFSCNIKSTRNAANVATYDYVVNGKSLYNYYYDGHRYDKGIGNWRQVDVQVKPFTLTESIQPTYSALREFAKKLTGGKETGWQPVSSIPNGLSIIINGKSYTKSQSGSNGNNVQGVHVPSGGNDMVIIGLHDVAANKDVLLGSTNSGGNNWGWFPSADGKVYFVDSNTYNGTATLISTIFSGGTHKIKQLRINGKNSTLQKTISSTFTELPKESNNSAFKRLSCATNNSNWTGDYTEHDKSNIAFAVHGTFHNGKTNWGFNNVGIELNNLDWNNHAIYSAYMITNAFQGNPQGNVFYRDTSYFLDIRKRDDTNYEYRIRAIKDASGGSHEFENGVQPDTWFTLYDRGNGITILHNYNGYENTYMILKQVNNVLYLGSSSNKQDGNFRGTAMYNIGYYAYE